MRKKRALARLGALLLLLPSLCAAQATETPESKGEDVKLLNLELDTRPYIPFRQLARELLAPGSATGKLLDEALHEEGPKGIYRYAGEAVGEYNENLPRWLLEESGFDAERFRIASERAAYARAHIAHGCARLACGFPWETSQSHQLTYASYRDFFAAVSVEYEPHGDSRPDSMYATNAAFRAVADLRRAVDVYLGRLDQESRASLPEIIATYEEYRALGVSPGPLVEALLLLPYARLLSASTQMVSGYDQEPITLREIYFRHIDEAYEEFRTLALFLERHPEASELEDPPYSAGCEICNIVAGVRAAAFERYSKIGLRMQQRQWYRGHYDEPRAPLVLYEISKLALENTDVEENQDLDSLIAAYETAMDLYRAP